MPLMSIATSAAAFALTSKIATLAPASASMRAVAAPRPEAPPVTTAACPAISIDELAYFAVIWLLLGGNRRARDDHGGGGWIGVKLFYQSRAMRKHRALVDRTLVGHFADIEGRRLGEQNSAHDAVRRAARRLCERPKQACELRSHPRMGEHRRSGRVGGKVGRKLVAGVEIGKHQRRHIVALGAREHHVAHQRRALSDEGGA